MPVAVSLRGSVNAGFAGVVLYNIIGLNSALKAALYLWTILETSIGAVTRVKSFEESTPSGKGPEGGEAGGSPPANWPEKGSARVESITASYGEDVDPVISNRSIDIEPGEKVGICGRSRRYMLTTISLIS